jgi:Ca2+-binding RTX toxin-like protein
VKSSITYTLPANVENLTLSEQPLTSPTSTVNDFNGTGNTLNNVITGNSGFNVIDGGAGADIMQGAMIHDPNNPAHIVADGNDTYIVDNVNDVVTEYSNDNNPANDGPGYILIDWIDTIKSSVSYTLPNFVEILQLTGGADLNGTGNTLDNIIYGNSGNNVLQGGADSLTSGTPPGPNEYAMVPGDTVSYQYGSTGGVTVSLALTTPQDTIGAGVDTLSGFENLTGSPYNDVLTGNSGPNVLNGGSDLRNYSGDSGADTLIGGDGNDTYIVDGNDTVVETNPNPAQIDTVDTWVNYTLPANVEVLRMLPFLGVYPVPTSPNINGTGNDLNNTLIGNAGKNVLDGGKGADTMMGGNGDDTYVVDNPGDIVIETNASVQTGGIDLVQSTISYTLPANVENLRLMGSGNLDGIGNTLDNIIYANRGNNKLDGGLGANTVSYEYGANGPVTVDLVAGKATGGSGSDTLANFQGVIGSSYDDTIIVNSAAKTLDGSLGSDTVSYQGFSVPVKVDLGGLGTKGSATAVGGVNETLINIENVTGSNFDDTLQGTVGNNVFDGGTGNDTVTYDKASTSGVVVSLATSLPQNTGGSGFDTLKNIENLIGSPYNDKLTGDGGNNILNGGAGNDILTGGKGDDTYIVDSVGDQVVENLSEGIDTVQSSITYTLPANVENLQLTGSGSINGFGNSLNNTISVIGTGSASNLLDGGAGADSMSGGNGNDTYIVDNTGDTVTEQANGGTDTVISSVNYTLPANVENLQLSGSAGSGNGNELNNVISGTVGNNILDGGLGTDTVSYQTGATAGVTVDLTKTTSQNTGGSGIDFLVNFENVTGSNYNDTLTGTSGPNVLTGGAGKDVLTGGAGADTFVYTSANDSPGPSKSASHDVITDFAPGIDKIDLRQWDANPATTSMDHWQFVTTPTTGAGQVRFDPVAHQLLFNVGGTVDAAVIDLTGVATIQSSDFLL